MQRSHSQQNNLPRLASNRCAQMFTGIYGVIKRLKYLSGTVSTHTKNCGCCFLAPTTVPDLIVSLENEPDTGSRGIQMVSTITSLGGAITKRRTKNCSYCGREGHIGQTCKRRINDETYGIFVPTLKCSKLNLLCAFGHNYRPHKVLTARPMILVKAQWDFE